MVLFLRPAEQETVECSELNVFVYVYVCVLELKEIAEFSSQPRLFNLFASQLTSRK